MAILGILAAILLPALAKPRYSITPPACIKFLKHLGIMISIYASDNAGRLPTIDDTRNNFIFEGSQLCPDYVVEPTEAHCPQHPNFDPVRNFRLTSDHSVDGTPKGAAHPDCITDVSYIYLGWVVTSDEDAEALFDAYDRLSPKDYDKDIIVREGKDADAKIRRLADSADHPQIPIMWDRPYTNPADFSHAVGDSIGGWVLYLDGHVEFVKFGEKFPMTETMARLLDERPRELIPDCE
jgi:hypothetical protein